MYSMTGYGKGVSTKDGLSITIEIKTVNHKSLDWGIKIPRNYLFLEDTIKKQIQSRIARGHVDVFLTFEKTADSDSGVTVDLALAKGYIKAAELIAQETGIENNVKTADIIKIPDVVIKSAQDNEDLMKELAIDALNKAIDNLLIMREKEGNALKKDLSTKLDTMSSLLAIIVERAPYVVIDYKNKLNDRIKELCAPQNVDEQRLATEVALFADHCAIDEEITRLTMHIKHVKELLDQSGPVGRNIDFFVQEFIRETNTIGSKANDMTITTQVLALKNEIEKIREQACNIE